MVGYYLIDKKIVYNNDHGEIFNLNEPEVKVKLSNPAAKCLQKLIDADHQIVSPDELIDDIWGQKGIIVGTNTLYQHIYILRKHLCSLGLDKNIIKTTPRSGFNIPQEFTIEPFQDKVEYVKQEDHQEQHQQAEEKPALTINELPKKKPGFLKKRSIYSLVVVLTLIIASSIYIYNTKKPLEADYTLIGKYQNCDIYGENGRFTLLYIKSRIENHNIECNNEGNQSLYYFGNPAIKRESIFLCDNRIDGDARSNCKSYHWTGYEN
ncbi:winged helix-turn-helix domain-containing protein [Serratia fonticola]|uniref:winged helix-turn-helix domain-containing protein n=1 Tax=Serratia fonticola TaxID=47917 RepID=UPI00217BCB7C|nr:winged helix-turn-helix domain-containing protein [Serratia fonticola]CAI1753810.1 Transcriptional regulatory protein, C terminal [Serratia fonticola]HBE9179709.1 winged helix-turn-helix domain-containing protein [Serratia fonticola]